MGKGNTMLLLGVVLRIQSNATASTVRVAAQTTSTLQVAQDTSTLRTAANTSTIQAL